MSITRKHTTARASSIVINNGVIYLAGQVAADPDADIQEQTRSTLSRVEALLEEAGSSKEHILSATICISTAREFLALNAANA